jgi:hypothetical protein
MQKQNWSLASQDHIVAEDENDDDSDVQIGNNTFYKSNLKKKDEEEEEQQDTLKAKNTQKTARETMIERKLNEADARGQAFTLVYIINLIYE